MKRFLIIAVAALTASNAQAEANALECQVLRDFEVATVDASFVLFDIVSDALIEWAADDPARQASLEDLAPILNEALRARPSGLIPEDLNRSYQLILADRCAH